MANKRVHIIWFYLRVYKILENAHSSIISKADQWLSGGKQLEKGEGDYKGHKGTFGGDGFMDIYIYQNQLNYTL